MRPSKGWNISQKTNRIRNLEVIVMLFLTLERKSKYKFKSDPFRGVTKNS